MKEFSKNQYKAVMPIKYHLRDNKYAIVKAFVDMLDKDGLEAFLYPRLLQLNKAFPYQVIAALKATSYFKEVVFYLKVGKNYHMLFSFNGTVLIDIVHGKVGQDFIMKAFNNLLTFSGPESDHDVYKDLDISLTGKPWPADVESASIQFNTLYKLLRTIDRRWTMETVTEEQLANNHISAAKTLPSLQDCIANHKLNRGTYETIL